MHYSTRPTRPHPKRHGSFGSDARLIGEVPAAGPGEFRFVTKEGGVYATAAGSRRRAGSKKTKAKGSRKKGKKAGSRKR